MDEAKFVTRKIGYYDAGNQISGDDEKDVDTDEAAANMVRKGVKPDDGGNRNRAKPVDVRTVTGR